MRSRRLLAWFATMALPLTATAQKVGPEFQVNTYTSSYQDSASVASDASGDFVVVWQSYGQDGSSFGIFGQRYASDGNPLGGEFQVNTYTTGNQGGFLAGPSVASDAAGNFVVVWYNQDPLGIDQDIFGQLYDSSGNTLGGEFQVNTQEQGSQAYPSVASDASGNFVVVWASFDLTDYGIVGQRYDSEGNRLGGAFQVSTYPRSFQQRPSVASDAVGDFAVVWNSFGQDGSGWGVFGQRYDSDGNPLGGEFQVNTYTANDQLGYSVASDASGNFVVVWTSSLQERSRDIFGQRYDSDGNPLGAEFRVNTYTNHSQDTASVTSDANGNFVVVWDSGGGQDGNDYGVFGQRYDRDGNRLGGEFQVSTYTTNGQTNPLVASDVSGNFVVVWTSFLQDGSQTGVFGQRFSAVCEASLQVQGDIHPPGSAIAVQVHIAHHRPKVVTVPWELRLLDTNGQRIVRHTTNPHTFERGDVVDREVQFRLPDDLAAGTYTLELAISGMAGTKGATTTFRVGRAE